MKKYLITAILLTVLFTPTVSAEEQNWVAVHHFETAQTYFKNSEYSKAIDEYKKALRANPYGLPERVH